MFLVVARSSGDAGQGSVALEVASQPPSHCYSRRVRALHSLSTAFFGLEATQVALKRPWLSGRFHWTRRLSSLALE